MTGSPPSRLHRVLLAIAACAAAMIGFLSVVPPAAAHGFSSVVYADVRSGAESHVRSTLLLEYDLLVVSAADAEHDDPLFQEGTAAFDGGDPAEMAAALQDHAAAVLAYVGRRFTVTSSGVACVPRQVGRFTMAQRQGVPYARYVLDAECPRPGASHIVTSRLFPDGEGYVRSTKTILTYEIDTQHGSAALDAEQPSFSTEQTLGERFWEFFRLGAEHLLTGIDHILFLLVLIAGSRRLREIVLAATTFTIAHSVTFILAATGLVTVSSRIIEPVIALSIAVIAGWNLWQLACRRTAAFTLTLTSGPLGLDRAGWLRLGVVFCFGLVHGLGFASALGIDEPWSWTLLWSLLVFNLGIEVVQLVIIAVVFPLLVLLRRRVPRVGLWVSALLGIGVAIAGLVWFVQRLAGAG